MIALYKKKAVRNVRMKPTHLAPLKSGMVLITDTVNIFSVLARKYIPTPKRRTTGRRAKTLTGIRNQNIPTPSVKRGGKINDKRDELIPNPSQREMIKRIVVKKVRARIAKSLNELSIKFIPIKPSDNKIEVNINLCSLDIGICENFLNVFVVIEIFQKAFYFLDFFPTYILKIFRSLD